MRLLLLQLLWPLSMVVVIIVVVTNLVVIIGRAARADSAAPSVSHPISRTKNQKKKERTELKRMESNMEQRK